MKAVVISLMFFVFVSTISAQRIGKQPAPLFKSNAQKNANNDSIYGSSSRRSVPAMPKANRLTTDLDDAIRSQVRPASPYQMDRSSVQLAGGEEDLKIAPAQFIPNTNQRFPNRGVDGLLSPRGGAQDKDPTAASGGRLSPVPGNTAPNRFGSSANELGFPGRDTRDARNNRENQSEYGASIYDQRREQQQRDDQAQRDRLNGRLNEAPSLYGPQNPHRNQNNNTAQTAKPRENFLPATTGTRDPFANDKGPLYGSNTNSTQDRTNELTLRNPSTQNRDEGRDQFQFLSPPAEQPQQTVRAQQPPAPAYSPQVRTQPQQNNSIYNQRLNTPPTPQVTQQRIAPQEYSQLPRVPVAQAETKAPVFTPAPESPYARNPNLVQNNTPVQPALQPADNRRLITQPNPNRSLRDLGAAADQAIDRTTGGSYFMTLLALFASIGLNLYLGWIAWDTYNRYQDLVADMRRTPGVRRERRSERRDRSDRRLATESGTY